jgi:hypothetical protein
MGAWIMFTVASFLNLRINVDGAPFSFPRNFRRRLCRDGIADFAFPRFRVVQLLQGENHHVALDQSHDPRQFLNLLLRLV